MAYFLMEMGNYFISWPSLVYIGKPKSVNLRLINTCVVVTLSFNAKMDLADFEYILKD